MSTSNLDKGLARVRAGAASLRSVDSAAVPEIASAVTPFVGESAWPAPALDIDRLESIEPDPRVLQDNRIVMDELSGASAAYKMLRTRVLQRMRRNNWKTLAVTGTCPNEGKSLTAINLSINLARHTGTNVVLVDLDLRKPSIHRHLGIAPRHGLSDYLRGGLKLQQIAVRPGVERLGVIMNERPFSNSSEILSSPEAADIVDQVKQGEGRIAVFDLPPVLASDDVLAFSPLVDAVLIVLAQGTTRRADLVAVRDVLQSVNVVGAVLNRSTEEVGSYYYGQHY
jgi:Mrp family chromosome partitioning ATPase